MRREIACQCRSLAADRIATPVAQPATLSYWNESQFTFPAGASALDQFAQRDDWASPRSSVHKSNPLIVGVRLVGNRARLQFPFESGKQSDFRTKLRQELMHAAQFCRGSL